MEEFRHLETEEAHGSIRCADSSHLLPACDDVGDGRRPCHSFRRIVQRFIYLHRKPRHPLLLVSASLLHASDCQFHDSAYRPTAPSARFAGLRSPVIDIPYHTVRSYRNNQYFFTPSHSGNRAVFYHRSYLRTILPTHQPPLPPKFRHRIRRMRRPVGWALRIDRKHTAIPALHACGNNDVHFIFKTARQP